MNTLGGRAAMRHVLLIGVFALGLALGPAGSALATAADAEHPAKEPKADGKPHGDKGHADEGHGDTSHGDKEDAKGAFLRQLAEQAIWTIVVFLALVLILGKMAWKPMLEGLQRR